MFSLSNDLKHSSMQLLHLECFSLQNPDFFLLMPIFHTTLTSNTCKCKSGSIACGSGYITSLLMWVLFAVRSDPGSDWRNAGVRYRSHHVSDYREHHKEQVGLASASKLHSHDVLRAQRVWLCLPGGQARPSVRHRLSWDHQPGPHRVWHLQLYDLSMENLMAGRYWGERLL